MFTNFSNIILERIFLNKIPFLFIIILLYIFSSIYSLPKLSIPNTLPAKYLENLKTNYIEENTNLYLVSTRDGYLHALNNKKQELWKVYLDQELMTSTLTARKITKNLYLFPFNEQIFLIDNGKIIPFDIYIKDLVKRQYISLNDFSLIGKTITNIFIIDSETGEILQKIDEESNFIKSKKLCIRPKNRRKKTLTVIRVDYILTCLEIKEGEKYWSATYSDIIIQRGNDNLENNNKFFMDYSFLNKLVNEYKRNNLENQEINYDNVITAYTYIEREDFPIVKIYDRTLTTKYLDFEKNKEMNEEMKYLDNYNKYKYEENSELNEQFKIYEDLNKYQEQLKLPDYNINENNNEINKIIMSHIIMNYIKNNIILIIVIFFLLIIILITLLYKKIKKKKKFIEFKKSDEKEEIKGNLIKNETLVFENIERAKSISYISNNNFNLTNYKIGDNNNENNNNNFEEDEEKDILLKKEKDDIKNNIIINENQNEDKKNNNNCNIKEEDNNNKENKIEDKKEKNNINNKENENDEEEEEEESDDDDKEQVKKESINKEKKISIWDDDDEDNNNENEDEVNNNINSKEKSQSESINNYKRNTKSFNNKSESEIEINIKPKDSEEIKPKKITRLDTDFENLEKIGEGGFGIVLKGTHRIDKYIYAIKIIDISNITDIKQKDDIVRETKKMSMIRDKYIVNYNICWYDDNLGSAEKFFASKKNDDSEDNSLGDISQKSKNSEGTISIGTINKKSEKSPFNSKYRFNYGDEFNILNCSIISKKYNKEIKKKNQKQYFHILMEYCDGNTLQDLIQDHIKKNIPIERKLIYNYIRQILKGLKILHKNGIIHSDIKPGNIFLKKIGNLEQVKIGDFGLAMLKKNKGKLLSKDLKGYTPQYSSPEQLKPNGTYNEKIDIYASGIILYEMCGCFGSEMEKHLAIKDLKNNRKIMDEIENKYKEESELIKIMTEEDYDKRPSAEQILKNDIFKELGKIVNK